ncbi:MAG: discoidin domain-containing protein [Janthinobacterium lividum]
MTEQKIVVYRTHFVDDRLMAFARSVHGHHGYQVIFAVDETHGSIDTLEFEKISLTREAFEPLGLYTEISDIFWRCGDYPLYLARLRFPECNIFWLIEYDVTINRAEPIEFFEELDKFHGYDFLSSHFRKPEDWWMFGFRMRAYSEDVYRSYFPLVRLSGRALDFAMVERAKATVDMRLLPNDQHLEWPNDESFIATVLQNGGFRCADYSELGHFYTNQTFWCTVLIHPTSLPPYDGLIYHCVRTGKHYLKLVLRDNWIEPLPEPNELLRLYGIDWSLDEVENPLQEIILAKLKRVGDNPDRVMAEEGIIARVLAQNSQPPVLRAVVKALTHERMRECLHVLRAWQLARWWPHLPILDNVALVKPAWQSSTSNWSKSDDAWIDAEGGNNGRLDVEYGFHTEAETQPWWTVDLMQTYLISKVCIHNRHRHSDRMNGFRLLASVDGHTWRVIHQSADAVDFGKTGDRPIKIELQARARFLRVQIPYFRYLHFREFEAYGVECG